MQLYELRPPEDDFLCLTYPVCSVGLLTPVRARRDIYRQTKNSHPGSTACDITLQTSVRSTRTNELGREKGSSHFGAFGRWLSYNLLPI